MAQHASKKLVNNKLKLYKNHKLQDYCLLCLTMQLAAQFKPLWQQKLHILLYL